MPLALAHALSETRERTLGLVAHLDDAALERPAPPLFGPLAWDLGHIAAYEDLWINHRLGGQPLRRPDLAALYDAFETPRAIRGNATLLARDELRAYLEDVREHAARVSPGDGQLHELVIRHELQHHDTMLQAMGMMGLLPPGWGKPQPPAVAPPGAELVTVPGADIAIGAAAGGFAYDNERPQHVRRVDAFRIARRPVTNSQWVEWANGGGYVRRSDWSVEGWAWRVGEGVDDHPGARAAHPDASVVHVSWHEADAYARATGARLPTEFEWEAAASAGFLNGMGDVWEWTSSCFAGYPGFVAHPYREYSEIFFGPDYRVLRGWSCVTAERVASVHFRNWDHPHRRQLFAGVRLAGDAS